MDTFHHKRSLGQNFLNSPVIPGRMCDAAELASGDTVLEIGPGTGALTAELLARGARVVAVEADARTLTVLRERFADAIASESLTLHHADARTLDPAALGLTEHAYAVVSNIPYYLTGFLLRTLLAGPVQPHTLVFLVQKEVGERIARSEKASLLSLAVAAFGDARYVSTVKRGHFTPAPAVDSAIIKVADISRARLGTLDPDLFFQILHLAFGQKRKQVQRTLRHRYATESLIPALTQAGIAPTSRPEAVSLAQWITLTAALSPADRPFSPETSPA